MKPTIALLTKVDSAGTCLVLVNKEALFLPAKLLYEGLDEDWGWDLTDVEDAATWGKALYKLLEQGWRAEYVRQASLDTLKIPKEAHFVIYNKATGLQNYLNTLPLIGENE